MRNDRTRWYQFLPIFGGCLMMCSCATSEEPSSPRVGNVACHQLDVGMGLAGGSAIPTDQIRPHAGENTCPDPGSYLFRTLSPQRGTDGALLYPPGLQLAATRPYASRPYFTVYAMRTQEGAGWMPASGVIQWPASGKDNAWLDVVSVPNK